MSKATKKPGEKALPTPADSAPVRPDTMSHGRRLLLMAIAIFCLLIFSVTGPMADTFGRWFFSGGERSYATMSLPGGKPAEITILDYQNALSIQQFRNRLYRIADDGSEEDTLYWAAVDKLADAFEVVVTTQELRDFLLPLTRNSAANYQNFYRGMGYRRPEDFEGMLGRMLRLQKMEQLLAAAAVVSEEDVVREWQELYREMKWSYAVWSAADFADAAAGLEPTEEQLQEYYAGKLTPVQRLEVEREEAVSVQLLVVDAEAAGADGVQRLIGSDFEPSEAALAEFYNSRSLSLYRRPLPEGETTLPEGVSAVLSMEEVGERLLRDFRIHTALKQAYLSLVGGADADGFAREHGLRLVRLEEPVPLSGIEKVETYGSFQLRAAFSGTPGTWMENPVMLPAGLGYLMQPIAVQPRELPALAEIRDAVTGFWREGEQQRLAREAAEAFIAGLPKGEGWVEGDPPVVGEEAFAQALAAERIAHQQQDWLSRAPRVAVDPPELESDFTARRVRSLLSGRLDDLVDGQVVGPEDFGAEGVLVIHLAGRRDPDPAGIWPNEVARARALAQQKAEQAFRTDQLSFEGFARAWDLTKVLVPESAE